MYIRMGALVVLPVRLLGFSVDATESGREIRWNVEAEDGVDYYEIERSQDGRAFQSIGRVPAKNQSGSYQYAFTDRQALTGKVFYRLKTVDVDGRFVFSNILVREADLNGSLFRFYPNPAKGSFSILRKGSGTATLQVFQLDGKLRLQKTIAYASENISLEGLAPGIYVVLLRTNSGDFRDRLVVQ